MIKEIKYNRCVKNFNDILNQVTDFFYFDCIYHRYNGYVLCTSNAFRETFEIEQSDIREMGLDCGLDDNIINEMLDNRFNNKKYRIVILL